MKLKTVSIPKQEFLYLRNTSFLPKSLMDMISTIDATDYGKYDLHLTADLAEEFRSAFTERLARVGFDSGYELTREGALLETLIDRFDLS